MLCDAAIQALRDEGLCLFPTETFFALGCDARSTRAVSRLLQLKQRPAEQGLPLLVAEMGQLPQACNLEPGPEFPEVLRELSLALMQRFWPGPLSLVLPAAVGLAAGVARKGNVALRQTPHPAAALLSVMANAPLVASSANLRGEPPVTRAKNLNPLLVQETAAVLDAPPAPCGGLPSTLARPVLDAAGRPVLMILRTGAVSLAALEAAGYPVVWPQDTQG